jgi:hypothetical protein
MGLQCKNYEEVERINQITMPNSLVMVLQSRHRGIAQGGTQTAP